MSSHAWSVLHLLEGMWYDRFLACNGGCIVGLAAISAHQLAQVSGAVLQGGPCEAERTGLNGRNGVSVGIGYLLCQM